MDTINNKVVGTIGVFSETMIGKINAGLINAKDVIVDGGLTVGGLVASTTVKAEHMTSETIDVTDRLIAKVIDAKTVQADQIVSPIIETDTIKLNILSPVSDEGLTIHMKKKRVEFVSPTNNKPVASIDDQGNASFSGNLTTQTATVSGSLRVKNIESQEEIKTESLTVSRDATVSGTLMVKDLIAEKINLPEATVDQIVAKLSSHMLAQIAALIANGAKPSEIQELLSPLIEQEEQKNEEMPVADLKEPEKTSTPEASMSLQDDIQTDFYDSASISALSNFIPPSHLTTETVTVTGGLMSFGPTSLSDTAVSGLLSIGGTMTFQNGAINTLGTDLELQPLRQGRISLMGGRIIIDKDGNAVFDNDLRVKGTLYANTLSPDGKGDLRVSLSENQHFTIGSASTSGNITVNGIGDLIASGTGRFKELVTPNLKVVRGASADTSETETIASASAGVGTIAAFENERTILSPFVKEDSLIYLTPASETYGTTPYIARQTIEDEATGTKGSFTIRIQSALSNEIKVNWWIIN